MNPGIFNKLNRIVFLALPALVGLCLFGCNRQSPPAPVPNGEHAAAAPTPTSDELPNWSLSEADSGSLGSAYKMSSFEIRPPAKFQFITHIPESNSYYWVGPIRTNETYPQFFVTITELPAQDANALLTESLNEVMGAIKQRRTDWSQTPAEQGKINGLPFIRCTWSGVATSAAHEGLAGRKMHGIVYLTVHNNHAVQIMCQDVAPEHGEWLKLGGLAALSFRVAPVEKPAP